MSPEEREALKERARRAAVYGPDPQGPVLSLPRDGAGSSVPDDVLAAEDLLGWFQQAEPITIRGKKAWVHRLEAEDAEWINAAAARESAHLPETDQRTRYQFRVWAYQVVRCLRRGPDPDAPPVFKPEQVDIIRRNLGWELQQRIVRISDRLGGSEDREREAVRVFFGAVRDFCETSASQLNEDTIEATRGALLEFASRVSAVNSQPNWTASDLEGIEVP